MMHPTTWFHDLNHSGVFQGKLRFDEPLHKHTYFRVGGPAQVLAIPEREKDLSWLKEGLRETGLPFFVLGCGSNVLFPDEGFPGVVIKLLRLDRSIREKSEDELVTGASLPVSNLLRQASKKGWGGLAFLTGVPGSIGGAVRMNAGTHLGEAKDALKQVSYFSFFEEHASVIEVGADQMRYSYRANHYLPAGAVVLSATWRIEKKQPEEIKAQIEQVLTRRKRTQPVDYPCCGSVFKNPYEAGYRSWEVLEKLGLRGYRIGEAQFSEKHANFIVNLGKARAADVQALIDLAKTQASEQLGIELKEEVIYPSSLCLASSDEMR